MESKKSRKRKKQSSEQANTSTSPRQSTKENSHSSGALGSHGLGSAAESAVHGTNPNRVSDPTPSYEFGHPGLAPSPSELNIQRALEGTGTSQDEVPDTVLDVLGDGGQSLEQPIQRTLEERMDADFSNVRIHTGAKAAEAADAIDAKAFTCGNDIVFNSGEYDPESGEGQFLLAHELAHVKQQTGAAISMMPQEGTDLEIDPDPQLEREADETAMQALSDDEPVVVDRLGTEVHVQRVRKDRAETMQAILGGNVVADDTGHSEELEVLSLPRDRKEAMDRQLEGVDPKTLVDPDRDSGISISLDNSAKETKYAFVKKSIEVLEEKEAFAEEFERTGEQLERAIADRNQIQNRLDRVGETGAQHRELQQRLKQKEAEIHELEGQLIRAHVELSKAVELAEALWDQVDVTELEGYYLDGEIEALQNELVSQWTAEKVLGAVPGISEILSVLKDVREAGEKFLRIKRARKRGVTIVEGEEETGMSDSTGDVDMEAEYEQ
ncbi:DUF4157 domain-containing protein [Natronolimnobius sp. AArcel1]|uniref:eCIS core domain-containing protein n=1 Tax=Natronolimnobius sp. AArcel1 TaxID=1679093 RepID=UPI001F14BD33|nr:DUF4157 domain-containing protein [Natronolimnobius sp. AArcel1]